MVVESAPVEVKVIVAESVSVEVTVTNVVVATTRDPVATTVPQLPVATDELVDEDVTEAAEVVVFDVAELLEVGLLTGVLVVDAGRGGPLTSLGFPASWATASSGSHTSASRSSTPGGRSGPAVAKAPLRSVLHRWRFER